MNIKVIILLILKLDIKLFILKAENQRFKGYIDNVNKVIKIGEEIWK